MKKLIIPIIILLSFSVALAQNIIDCPNEEFRGRTDVPCPDCPDGYVAIGQLGCQSLNPESEWLTNMKEMYSEYIDSGQFFPIAIAIFFPIIIGALAGIASGKQAHVSRFLLELILGVLMFLVFPYLNQILTEMIV